MKFENGETRFGIWKGGSGYNCWTCYSRVFASRRQSKNVYSTRFRVQGHQSGRTKELATTTSPLHPTPWHLWWEGWPNITKVYQSLLVDVKAWYDIMSWSHDPCWILRSHTRDPLGIYTSSPEPIRDTYEFTWTHTRFIQVHLGIVWAHTGIVRACTGLVQEPLGFVQEPPGVIRYSYEVRWHSYEVNWHSYEFIRIHTSLYEFIRTHPNRI
jgi:hypothetical protein